MGRFWKYTLGVGFVDVTPRILGKTLTHHMDLKNVNSSMGEVIL